MIKDQATQLRNQAVHALRAQAGHPTGIVGRGMVLLMTYRPSNRERNIWAVSRLDVRSDDRVLELGFGPGHAIAELSRLATDGYVCGIDHSELMVRAASKRNADGITRGIVDLRLGSVDQLPEFDRPFDKILTVNAAMFWGHPAERLAQIRRLLRLGGRIALVHQPRGPGATNEAAAGWGQEIAAVLRQAGFSSVKLETLNLTPAVVCALAINESAT